MKPFFYHKLKAKQALRGRVGKSALVAVFMTFLTLFVNMYLSVIFKDNVKLNLIAELVITAFVIIPFTMGKSLFFMSFLDPELKVSVASMMDGYKYIIKLIPYIILELLLSVIIIPPIIIFNIPAS